MSIKTSFLTLSIREQICLTIIALSLFCFVAVYGICIALSYEFLKEDYKCKKLYFLNKYKDYLEACFYFQNFCLLQYEEIIKYMQKQSYEYYQKFNDYDLVSFDDYTQHIISYNDSIHKDITTGIDRENPELYLLYFANPDEAFNEYKMKQLILHNYQSMVNTIFFHDIYDSFRIPGYNVPIINSVLFTEINYSSIFSFNSSKIHHKLNEIQGFSSYLDYDMLKNHFREKIKEMILKIHNHDIIYYLSKNFEHIGHMYYKIINDIKNNVGGQIGENLHLLYGYLSSFDFNNSKSSLISLVNYEKNFHYLYCEADIINDYLYFMHNKITQYIDINFIPLFNKVNTIISPELCFLFMLKQIGFLIDNNKANELFNEIKKSKSTLESCFLNKDIIKKHSNLYDILKINFTNFLNVNNLIFKGIMKLNSDEQEEYPYFFMKYPFPNYNILKDFNSEYLHLEQVNFYLYASFKEPVKLSDSVLHFSQNCIILITMLILYVWIISLFINIFIFYRVINSLIQPIIQLQKAIESSSIKDENIFKYNYDDIINELFVTCKELLNGQIENRENGIKNFNILSIPKDNRKKTDDNLYKKNLIINNEIMNDLIHKQQTMMDFSNNIKLNQLNNYNQTKEKRKKKLKRIKSSKIVIEGENEHQSDEDNLISTLDNNTIETNNKKSKFSIESNSIEKNEDKDKDKEPYKKLFIITEYLDDYRYKYIKKNNVIVGHNSIVKDNKTKIITKQSRYSMKQNNLKKSIANPGEINDNNDNIHINMIDEENICYLWYMTVKKKNNIIYYNLTY